MTAKDNVTALLYRRRHGRSENVAREARGGREMAFDPFLVFTAVLVGGAVVGQMVLVFFLEF